MDQDFHYYGTYYAARVGGEYIQKDATLIAKACNFIDFMSHGGYGGYWYLVSDQEKRSDQNYNVIAKVDYPRYTYQGELSTGLGGSSGLWASFHFPPGNYDAPADTPTKIDVHGKAVADLLPNHEKREINPEPSLKEINSEIGKLLNRPQSALSRAMILDTINCLNEQKALEAILRKAKGGEVLLNSPKKEDILKRFGLILLGIRAHVIADTWAHQDWCAVNNVINTYWDIDNNSFNDQFSQNINYQDVGSDWKKVKLSGVTGTLFNANLIGAPNYTSYAGHGWMGHFPDYSFIKYRYKPCWSPKSADALERDNPTQYKHAFLELCSLFSQANGRKFFEPNKIPKSSQLDAAQKAISSPVEIANQDNCPRVYSANKWKEEMGKENIEAPMDLIDTKQEPDKTAVLSGQIDYIRNTYDLLGITRYGTYYVDCISDLYLFHIAADYQFHFVKNWTKTYKIGPDNLFEDSWSTQLGPLSN